MVDLTENTGGQGSAPITFLPILAQIQAVLIMILGALLPWSGDVAECSIGRLRLLKHASDRIF
ncbi:hypothetical protein D5F52_07515 [Brevibacillus laterosporus]|nr:hypothetical protein D5F52_07515 [Brevibacillus laterosporus]